jgi:hypothetical protein
MSITVATAEYSLATVSGSTAAVVAGAGDSAGGTSSGAAMGPLPAGGNK